MGIETCVTVTWIKFAGQMLRLTGDVRYADAIELATYNALLGAQGTDGRWWAHHSPLAGVKERAPEQCDLYQNCCVASGPRGLMLLPQLAVMRGAAGPVVNFYGAMTARVALRDGGEVTLTQETNYPESGDVKLSVDVASPAAFALQLRIPAWSRATRIAVNGEAETGAIAAGSYYAVKRTWRRGDVVTLAFDLQARVVRAPGDPAFATIVRGPIVLARDARFNADVDAPLALTERDGDPIALEARARGNSSGVWMSYRLPRRDGPAVVLCDFASAGNTWSAASRYRVWARTE
jgi:DUF1680 family protein